MSGMMSWGPWLVVSQRFAISRSPFPLLHSSLPVFLRLQQTDNLIANDAPIVDSTGWWGMRSPLASVLFCASTGHERSQRAHFKGRHSPQALGLREDRHQDVALDRVRREWGWCLRGPSHYRDIQMLTGEGGTTVMWKCTRSMSSGGQNKLWALKGH